ncbi:MAG: response regulator [Chloroflexota bacterium]|nr:response regulator [Chloroflexota bacterium]
MMPARNTFADWDILLVDDSIESLNVLEIVLKHYGAVVHRATQGAEALDVITAVRPRLIICDLAMPVMDGWDLITRLKQDPTLARTPIIVLTAHAQRGERERALAAGYDAFFTKPITPGVFIEELLVMLHDFDAET